MRGENMAGMVSHCGNTHAPHVIGAAVQWSVVGESKLPTRRIMNLIAFVAAPPQPRAISAEQNALTLNGPHPRITVSSLA